MKNSQTINPISDVRVFPSSFLEKVAYLKRIYRFAVANYVPWNRETVRDNLVHTPENFEELKRHMDAFRERFYK